MSKDIKAEGIGKVVPNVPRPSRPKKQDIYWDKKELCWWGFDGVMWRKIDIRTAKYERK